MRKGILGIVTMFVLCIGLIGSQPVQGQKASNRLFFADFEDQKLDAWQIWGKVVVAKHDGNYRLTGAGSEVDGGIVRKGFEWADYTFGVGVWLVQGHINLNFRCSPNTKTSYLLGLTKDFLDLGKSDEKDGTGDSPVSLARSEKGIQPNTWAYVEIKLKGGQIQVYVDGELRIDYKDAKPILKGTVGLEILPGAKAYFDEVEVTPLQ